MASFKDLGVSHTAFRRHSGSREGTLNALAVQGNDLLRDALRAAQASGDFIDVGVAYVTLVLAHPGHFTVMVRSDLLDNDDPELFAARTSAFAPLAEEVAAMDLDDPETGRRGVWRVT